MDTIEGLTLPGIPDSSASASYQNVNSLSTGTVGVRLRAMKSLTVNLEGEVIGVNTAIASHNGTNSGVAFSIPINLVKQVTRQLLEKGNVTRGYLGMQLAQSFEPGDALQLGLDRVQGARVEVVYAGTPADAAGLRANDVVLHVDAVLIRNENHLINLISELPPGKKVRLEIWRDRRTQVVDAVVGDWSRAQTRFSPGQ